MVDTRMVEITCPVFFELDEPALRNKELISRKREASGHTKSK
jgi:hypothetical protein